MSYRVFYQNQTGYITCNKIIPYIKDLVEQKQGTQGMAINVKRIQSIMEFKTALMTLKEANIIKRHIYKELNDVSSKFDAK